MARILMVDDDKELLFLISEYLSVNGFESELAYSAAQARNCLENAQFDAVLSDFSMPGESGLDLLDYVSRCHPGLPFIMMTGSTISRLKDEAMRRGSSGYIVKPFEFRDLIGAIEMVLGFSSRRARDLALTA